MLFICFSTDFRTQRLDVPNAAVYWQQGGTNTNRGRVALLWRDRGSEWMAEPQRWEHHSCRFHNSLSYIFMSLCHLFTFVSPQTETVDSRSACTARAARLYHQITTLFPTRVRSWRHGLQVIWLEHLLRRVNNQSDILLLSTISHEKNKVLVHNNTLWLPSPIS